MITFAEQEIDRTCRAGEEGWFVSDGRSVRPTGGFTLPRMPGRPRRAVDENCNHARRRAPCFQGALRHRAR
ncbi:hypothetical protein B7767_36070 [Streptomyces sp. 13-12-16]|nr:hypothetical protein B7767_36070 [Streptomyces sp. 13-12-16]